MAKRVTNIGTNVEYKDSPNKFRVTNLGANVEYKDSPNKFRVTNIGLMVEYTTATAPTTTKYGPLVQIF